MIKYNVFVILFSLLSTEAFLQSIPNDSISTLNKKKIEDFKFMLNRQFTKITTGTALSNLGSFASISSDAKSFALGANIVTDRTVWGLQLSGGATEGIFKLFNNEV